jgi:hypothetical protein
VEVAGWPSSPWDALLLAPPAASLGLLGAVPGDTPAGCIRAVAANVRVNTVRMDSDTGSDQLDPGGYGYPDPESYWRRRFFILVGGLVLVGGITWVLSVMAGPVKPIRVAERGHGGPHGSLAARDTLPRAAYGAPAGAASTVATTGATPPVRPAGGALRSSGVPSASMAPAPSPSPPAGSAGTCSPGSIVLSLFTSQSRYGPRQQPRFEVYAVSTAPGTCEIAYRPSAVSVVITRKGRVIWDSTACVPQGRGPAAPGPVRFTQGVPLVTVVTWDRQASSTGCGRAVPAGTAGTFDAVALADGMSSQVRAFSVSP